MGQCLFGVETEYAIAMLDDNDSAVGFDDAAAELVGLAGETLPSLSDGSPRGYFLETAGRLYLDSGHPEYSTPECAHPDDIVRHVHAGNRIVRRLADVAVARSSELCEALVMRCNVDYSGSGTTWGSHESYLYASDPAPFPAQMIPHLVSRIVYSGAGGFNNLKPGRLEFTLSPRAFHMLRDIADGSNHSRGVFHTKDEPLSRAGLHRLHVVCGESLCSELALWLKIGTTALVVAMVDAGLQPGDGVEIDRAVYALRRFAADPSCRARVRCADGRRRSAIEIQRHYLEAAERSLTASFMPPWAGAVCARWRDTLERLEHGPSAVAGELDWAIKLALFEDQIDRHGFDRPRIARWNRAMASCRPPTPEAPDCPFSISVDVPPDDDAPASRRKQEEAARRQGLPIDELKRFTELRDDLLTLDARFGELGEHGVFGALDAAGVLSHRVVADEEIERAVTTPPQSGRARLRGEQVRLLHRDRDRYTCRWDAVIEAAAHRYLDLADPFAVLAEWRPLERGDPRRLALELPLSSQRVLRSAR